MLLFGWWALLGLVLLCAGAIGLTAFRYGLLPTLVGGAPFMPTNDELVDVMIKLAHLTPNDRVVDLGSGDGRLVFAAAQAGARIATGYEIDVFNVWKSRARAKTFGVANARFITASFWKVRLDEVDVVFIYGLPPYMKRLADKCRAELKPGARIVSLLYPLPGWEVQECQDDVLLYRV